MFSTVLVGIDEETRGRDEIALARRLVSPTGRLIIAHVHAAFALPGKADTGEPEAVHRDGALELVTSVIRESGLDGGSGPAAEPRVLGWDRIGAGLHHLAEMTCADLVVIGSSREGRSGRVWLRDEMRQAINGCPCAVAVAPRSYAEFGTPITQIGVAYNGSTESLAALEMAQALALELRADTTAFEALTLPREFPEPVDMDSLTTAIQERQAEAAKQITWKTGVTAVTSSGDAASEIAVFSGSVDLLVIGSRGYGPLGRLVHGSTTHQLLKRARTPVLVLTRGARRQAAEREPDLEADQGRIPLAAA